MQSRVIGARPARAPPPPRWAPCFCPTTASKPMSDPASAPATRQDAPVAAAENWTCSTCSSPSNPNPIPRTKLRDPLMVA